MTTPSTPIAAGQQPAAGLWQTLRRPLWPDSRLELTTPLTFLLMGLSILLGIICYVKGYTFDGGTLVYLVPLVIFSRKYYARAYKGWAFLLILVALIPFGNYVQQKLQEYVQMFHPPASYLLGRVTAEGDGPFKWTRFIYTGQELPAIDGSVDHLLLSYWFSTAFMIFFHWLPERFKQPSKAARNGFYGFFILFSVLFAVLPQLFPNKSGRSMDYLWLMTSMSFVYTWIGLALSKSFRRLVSTPGMLMWMAFMGLVLSPMFETLHSNINNDYIYPAENNMTVLFTLNGAPITVNAPFYHIGYSVLFPAFLGIFTDLLARFTVRDRKHTYAGELDAASGARP
jgi:hypothetical protein